MRTVLDIFSKFGDTAHVAKLLGVTDQAVRNMRSRGVIPPRHFATLVREAGRKGLASITLDALVGLNARAARTEKRAA